jgi:D-serine deaminase-like pyridoxal phosphate-dependent protein
MGDEHGAIYHPSALPALRQSGGDPLKFAQGLADLDADAAHPWPADAPKPGGVVWLQPGHCDPTVNLHDGYFVVDEDGACELWPIDARRTAL